MSIKKQTSSLRNKITCDFLEKNITHKFGATWCQMNKIGNGEVVEYPTTETLRLLNILK